MKQLSIILIIFTVCCSCTHPYNSRLVNKLFADTPVAVPIKPGIVDEASGIADGRANPGFLWVEQDSGNPPEVALMAYNGTVLKKIPLKGAQNRDWEDMALSKGPEAGAYYIYLADIGDNFLKENDYAIFRFKEPPSSTDTITVYDKITFKYPDGANNAEAIFVEANSKDIYIITKSNVKTNIYKLPYPQSTTTTSEAVLVGSLPFTIVVGASISPDDTEIVVKNYDELYYWKRTSTETIAQALQRPGTRLGYQLEAQGEAIGFKNDNSGFFTTSEKPAFTSAVSLNFYKRF